MIFGRYDISRDENGVIEDVEIIITSSKEEVVEAIKDEIILAEGFIADEIEIPVEFMENFNQVVKQLLYLIICQKMN